MLKLHFYIVLFILLFSSCKGGWHRMEFSTMEPNIKLGSSLKIKHIESYTYGDVVLIEGAFDYSVVFRIVALPGDSIAVEDNVCVINGIKSETRFDKNELDEYNNKIDQLIEKSRDETSIKIWIAEAPSIKELANMSSILVPENHFFVMGDYRTGSADSRVVGSIPIEKIKGKVIKVIVK